jgi:hypothetical protein
MTVYAYEQSDFGAFYVVSLHASKLDAYKVALKTLRDAYQEALEIRILVGKERSPAVAGMDIYLSFCRWRVRAYEVN